MAFVAAPTALGNRGQKKLVCAQKPQKFVRANRAVLVRNPVVMSATVVEKGAGMRLIKNADNETIEKLGCRSWGTWGCQPSTFPWTYSDDEVCLVLKGDFTVIPDDGSEKMDVKAGDIAYFPKSMSCTWEVREEVHKHFAFGIKL